MLQDKDIDIVLNITVPKGHYEICKKCLIAGKHVYVEKPFSLNIREGQELVKLAEQLNLYIGGAPDTFLGVGIQTAINAIDNNMIGKVVAGTAFMACHGHESWHPAPDFYYQEGGGPLLDMGPYYITALVALLGPVSSVMGSANISFDTRKITSKPKEGQSIKVETPTHISANLQFASGAMITLLMSFDVYAHNLPIIELYGSEGSLSTPAPNSFSGEVKLNVKGEEAIVRKLKPPFISKQQFKAIQNVKGYNDNSRGLGLVTWQELSRKRISLERVDTWHIMS